MRTTGLGGRPGHQEAQPDIWILLVTVLQHEQGFNPELTHCGPVLYAYSGFWMENGRAERLEWK